MAFDFVPDNLHNAHCIAQYRVFGPHKPISVVYGLLYRLMIVKSIFTDSALRLTECPCCSNHMESLRFGTECSFAPFCLFLSYLDSNSSTETSVEKYVTWNVMLIIFRIFLFFR